MPIIPVLPLTALSFVTFYKTCRFVKFYGRLGFGLGLVVFFHFLLMPIFICRPKSLRNTELIATVARKLIPLFELEYFLEGRENVPEKGSFIIVSNHQTPVDIFGQCVCCGVIKNVVFTCNRIFSWLGTFGFMGWLIGIVFIERRFSPYTETQLNAAIERMRKEEVRVWFYPEGRLNMDYTGEIRRFKKGAFHCAIKAKVPIVPIVFSPNTWFDRKEKKFERGSVTARILPSVSTENLTTDDVDKLLQSVRNTMIEHYKDLKKIHQ